MGHAEKAMSDAVTHAANREGKFLTFSLAGEEYGIGILKIREIIGMMPITSVPETPAFVKGVINLRGKVIPVVDLRRRFGMPMGGRSFQRINCAACCGTGWQISLLLRQKSSARRSWTSYLARPPPIHAMTLPWLERILRRTVAQSSVAISLPSEPARLAISRCVSQSSQRPVRHEQVH
jgi:chemotaxis signal transduction protein